MNVAKIKDQKGSITVLKVLRKLGIEKPLRYRFIWALDKLNIQHKLGSGDLAEDIRRFMDRSPRSLKAWPDSGDNKKVLFFSARGVAEHMPYVTGVMAHGLRLRGVTSKTVLCDEILPACESVAITEYLSRESFFDEGKLPTCQKCYPPAAEIMDAFELPFMRLSQYITPTMLAESASVAKSLSLEEIFSYEINGVGIGEHVRTSLYRYLLAGVIEPNLFNLKVAQKYLTAGITLYHAIRRILEQEKPFCLVSHHGIYLIGGLSSEIAKIMGIQVVTWDATYRRNTIIVSRGESYHFTLRQDSRQPWINKPLTENESQRLDAYFDARCKGGNEKDFITYHLNPINEQDRIVSMLNLDKSKKTLALFTNVAWDGRVHVPDGIFDGPVEWVIESLRHLAHHPEYQVIVRIHPAEVKNSMWVAQQRMDDEIKKAFPALPKNSIIIPPESDINSYKLAELSDASIVYSTKMGLEIMLMGKPVIIAGDAFYGHQGFGIEPHSLQEYYSLLDCVDDIKPITEDKMTIIRRYAYYFYFRRAVPVPYVRPNPQIAFVRNLEAFLPGREPGLDAFCDGILNQTAFILD